MMSPEQFSHYLVGNPKFDAEHYLMFQKINQFRNTDEPSTEQGIAALTEILDLFNAHCEDEEQFMEEKGFPYLQYHKQMHNVLRKKLEWYINLAPIRGSVVKHELYDFSIILAHHIDEADLQFYNLHRI